MTKTVAIVDAFSAGNQFADFWRLRGYQCVHVQSQAQIPAGYKASFRPVDFIANVIHGENVQKTSEALRKYSPEFCIAGIESGVELADALSEKMNLITNGTKLSQARRDKFHMGQALASSGLNVAKQQIFTDLEAMKRWVRQELSYPVVVKPTKSAGSDNVLVCQSEAELEAAFNAIYGHSNKLGIRNEQVLVQEYVDGFEYAVNSVSFEGKHRFTHIWKYHKKQVHGASFVYDWEELLRGEGAEENALYEYVAKVLDALGIRYGAAHAEVKISKNGPKLIEVAARIDGIANPTHDALCVGKSQIELCVEFYTDPAARPQKHIEPYRRKQAAYNISLISDQEGTVAGVPGLDVVRAMKSYVDCKVKPGIGDRLAKTIDIFTSPGMAYLAHSDEAVAHADYDRIREMESRQEFFITKDES